MRAHAITVAILVGIAGGASALFALLNWLHSIGLVWHVYSVACAALIYVCVLSVVRSVSNRDRS